MDKIIWLNEKIYSHDTVVNRIKFVEKNMDSLLPLYPKELAKLSIYAKENGLPLYEMICLRNTIRIQKEIDLSKVFHRYVDKIKKLFTELVRDPKQIKQLVKNFFRQTKMPVHFVLKTISKMNEFNTLSNDHRKYFNQIYNDSLEMEHEIRERSILFEHTLEDFFKINDISFRTESDIKRDKDYLVTPDILFDKPITLVLDGVEYLIRWIDAKNYTLTNTPFIIKSLRKQGEKYNNIFGLGAFVFHYGFDSTIKLPNVLVLDGSILDQQ